MISAQRSAEELKANATKEAQIILQDAELKARTAANEAYAEKQKLEHQTAGLRNAEEEFRFKFRAMLEGYLKQIATLEKTIEQPAIEAGPAETDFARQAEAIKEAIAREDTVVDEAPEARGPAPEAPPVAGPAPEPPAPAEPEAAVEFGPAPAFVEAPESDAPPASEHILVGDEDDLLADMDGEVGENEFKW